MTEIFSVNGLAGVLTIILALSGCGGGGGGTARDSVSENEDPVVDAGPDQNVNEQTQIALKGTAFDGDGSISSYHWSQISGPIVSINKAEMSEANLITPELIFSEILELQLTVTDNEGGTASDNIIVIVNPVNSPPTVNAGYDQSVHENNSVTLRGSATDGDGNIATYRWIKNSGLDVIINDVDSVHASFIAPSVSRQETINFHLEVIDNEGASATDSVVVIIHPKNSALWPLNDTGVTWSADPLIGNYYDRCISSAVAKQDCDVGRDVTYDDNEDGQAGFSYSKIDAEGNVLLPSALEWSCVKDNVSGLFWEIKNGGNGTLGDEGLHDEDDRYTWLNNDPLTNGGRIGRNDYNGNTCHGYDAQVENTYCNTEAYVQRVNAEGLCGFSDWRLPTSNQLMGLINFGYAPGQVKIDHEYFPQAYPSSGFHAYWSGSATLDTTFAWAVYYTNGRVMGFNRTLGASIRLVRGIKKI